MVFEMLQTLNRSFGVTVIIVTHYPAVSQFVDRVVHIRDGRISSETISTASYRPGGGRTEDEFLVVDEAGRLQLPEEYADRFRRRGLARIGLEDGRITLLPPTVIPQIIPSPLRESLIVPFSLRERVRVRASPMNNGIISASSLTRAFESGGSTVWAVNGVDLDVKAGELLAVTGRSGSGQNHAAQPAVRAGPSHRRRGILPGRKPVAAAR